MKKSDILKKAREIFESGKVQYVCLALRYVKVDTSEEAIIEELKQWIRQDLLENKFDTYGAKLKFYSGKDLDFHGQRQARIAWMDWMIQYWKEQENEKISIA